MTTLLKADQVTKRFGGLTAVSELDFDARGGLDRQRHRAQRRRQDDVLQLPHRLLPRRRGQHHLRRRPDPRAAAGRGRPLRHLADLPEHPAVREHDRASRTSWSASTTTCARPGSGRSSGRRSQRREEAEAHDEALRLLEFVGLKGRGDSLAVKLPYGDQRRLEVARALANKPRLLLLDEPTAGMNPSESLQMTDFFRKLRGELGITILLIEHEMRVVMGISEKITVLDYGQKIAEGTPKRDPAATRASSRPTWVATAPPRRPPQAAGAAAPTPPARRPEPTPDDDADPGPVGHGRQHVLRQHPRPARASRWRSCEGEIVALIGGNGAGKSTTLNSISGLVRPQSGHDPAERRGPGAVPGPRDHGQGHRPGPRGPADLRPPDGRPRTSRWAPSSSRTRRPSRRGIERAFALFPRLKERESQVAGTLSGGEQQMLAMGRGLMSDPKVLLLDEPSMGLAPVLVDQIFDTISELHARGHDDPAGRAERPQGAPDRRPRLRHRDRPDRARRTRPRTCATTRRSRRPTSASTDHGRRQRGSRAAERHSTGWRPAARASGTPMMSPSPRSPTRTTGRPVVASWTVTDGPHSAGPPVAVTPGPTEGRQEAPVLEERQRLVGGQGRPALERPRGSRRRRPRRRTCCPVAGPSPIANRSWPSGDPTSDRDPARSVAARPSDQTIGSPAPGAGCQHG